MKPSSVILGIDPGTNILGYAIISVTNNRPSVVTLGVLKLGKYTDHYDRLHKIFQRVAGLIEEFQPDQFAIESTFYGKNVQSMLKLGRAQGVCIAAAANSSIPVFEYSPRRIKQVITGRGGASKEQVSGMLHHQLQFDESKYSLDATDALAVALCHHHSTRNPILSSGNDKKGGWDEFIRKNPGRIK